MTRGRVLYAHKISNSSVIIESGAFIYGLGDSNTVRILAQSTNGAPLEGVDQPMLERSVLEARDPCGGCNGSGGPGDTSKKSGTTRTSEIDVACVLGAAGCVGYGVAWAATAGVACILYLVTNCGSIIAAGGCCETVSSTHHVWKGAIPRYDASNRCYLLYIYCGLPCDNYSLTVFPGGCCQCNDQRRRLPGAHRHGRIPSSAFTISWARHNLVGLTRPPS